MTNLAALGRAVFFLFLLCFLTGCFPLNRSGLEEEKDPHYLEGTKRLNSYDYEGAIQSFERALQTNPKNSAAHLQLGVLYERMNDYGSALYHYQRHLALKPDSNMADVVKQKIIGCTRELARNVALVVAPGHVQQEMARLAQANDDLKRQVLALQQQLASKPQVITNTIYVPQVGSAPRYEAPEEESTPEPEPPVRIAEIPRPTPLRNDPPAPVRNDAPAPQNNRTGGANTSGGWVPTTITPPAGGRSQPPPTRSNSPRRIAHRLQKGETIAALSRRYDVSISEIIAANPGIRPDHVQVGQTIYIPGR